MKTLITALVLFSSLAHAGRFVVEADKVLSQDELDKQNFHIERFYPTDHPYFSRLYVVEGDLSVENLQRLSWVKLAEPSIELLQFSLLPPEAPRRLVEDELFPYQWGLLNQGQTYIRE